MDTAVLLDIGGDVGALVLYVPDEYRGREIEVSPVEDDGRRTHTEVLERRLAGRRFCAAVYAALPAGEWRIRGAGPGLPATARIEGGAVAEVDWR